MISLKVIDVKAFMNSLLVQNVFDQFYLWEADFKTFGEFSINGKLNEDYYSSDELEMLGERKYATWAEVKPFAFFYVKGNKLPVFIKIIMIASEESVNMIMKQSGLHIKMEEIKGLFFNIKYDKGNLLLSSGISFKNFTLDKTIEKVWDTNLVQFLKEKGIATEEV
ncbi:MAG: DUF5721 family protein [Anaerocolumna sp.]